MGDNEKEALLKYSSLDLDEVFTSLNTNIDGLSDDKAEKRLQDLGKNILSKEEERGIIIEFLSHFKTPLILILLFAAAISVYFGETINATIILVLVFLSVTLDFFQEHSAGKAAKKLRELVKTNVSVLRSGKEKEVSAQDICIGDVILLNSGDLVPADARIISSKDLFINESALTGESYPAEKCDSKILNQNAQLSDLKNILFFGTHVISGTAKAVIIGTGKNTEFGKIAKTLSKPDEKSEFEIGVTNFGYLIMKIMLFLVLFIFLFNSIVKHDILQSLLFSIAIAVGITPELLPMIMSVTMAKGSQKMAKKGVIVKKLTSIPTLGSMDVLCTDKTGTLTQNKIELVTYTDINKNHSEKVLLFAYINSHYQTGIKNLLDDAVLEYRKIDVSAWAKIDEIPFDFQRKRMSIVTKEKKDIYLVTKGAPEEVLNVCKTYSFGSGKAEFTEKSRKRAIMQYQELSRDGFRVLAIAIKKVKNKEEYTKDDEKSLEFVGFISFLDPPKRDAKEVLHHLKEIGIEVKIITGDNELVTKKVCMEIGLEVKGVLLGNEALLMGDEELKIKAEKANIFARFSPDQKNRIISILKSNGHVVGYMGDGINDAPSLKTADVGISVDSAVDIAREAADVVLTKKSLDVLKEGIIDGRKAFGNTMKYIMMGLSSNFGNMFSAAGAILFLPFLPMLPIQILLINFIYDFSQITIPEDDVDHDWVKKPKRWNLGFVKKFMYVFGPLSSIFDFLTFFVLFYIFSAQAATFQTGWFLESLATQTLVIYIIRTKKTPFIDSSPSIYLLLSTLACVVFGWILPYTPIGKFFGFVPLSPMMLLAIGGVIVLYLITIEFAKKIFYRKYDF